MSGKIEQMGENSGRYLDDSSAVVNIINAAKSAIRTIRTDNLSSTTDSIDIAKMSKGNIATIYTATLTATITADTTTTAGATSIVGFNSILLETTLGTAGNTAKTDIYGALSAGGTMVSVIDKDTSAQMTTGLLTTSQTRKFTGLPDYLGFTTTLSAGMTAGSSVMVKMLPLNL